MTAHDLWVLGIFQDESGPDALHTMYHMDINFWMRIGTLAERELPAYYEAARRRVDGTPDLRS